MSSIQNSIDQLLNSDIALKVLVNNTNDPPGLDTAKSNNIWGYKWIDIPTNTDTMLGFKDGDPIKSVVKDKKITFLVLQKYDQAKTNEISEALSLRNAKSPGIKFTSNGTIIIENSVTAGSVKLHGNYSNPKSNTGDVAKTVEETFYNGNLISWDNKKIMSEDLKYILWFNDNDNLFYLLYNPIHRTNFKQYYRLSLLTGEVNTSGEPVGTLGFHKLITKYCNAFTVDGKHLISQYTSRMVYPEIYLDPFCSVLMDRVTTVLNSSIAGSITSSYWKNYYWKETKTRDKLIDLFARESLKPGNYHSWACAFRGGTPGSLKSFASSKEFFSEIKNNTFIADVARLDINAHTRGYTSAQAAYNALLIADENLPECGTGTTINCNLVLIANYGDISGNTNSNECMDKISNAFPDGSAFGRPPNEQPPNVTSGLENPLDEQPPNVTSGLENPPGKKPSNVTSGLENPPGKKPSDITPLVSGTKGPNGLQPVINTDIIAKTSIFKDWKPLYTYILVAILVFIIGISVYFLISKSKITTMNTNTSSVPLSTAPLEAISTFGRYRYR